MTANHTTSSSVENASSPVISEPVSSEVEANQPLSSNTTSKEVLPPTRIWSQIVATLAMLIAALCVWMSYGMYKQNQTTQRDIKTLKDLVDAQQDHLNSTIKQAQDDMVAKIRVQAQAIESLPSQAILWVEPQLLPLKAELEQRQVAQANQENRLTVIERRQDAAQILLSELPSQKVLWQMIEVVQLQRSALKRLVIDRDIASAQSSLEMSTDILRPLNIGDKGALLRHSEAILQSLRNQASIDPYHINDLIIDLGKQLDRLDLIDSAGTSLYTSLTSPSLLSKTASSPSSQEEKNINPVLPWYQALWRDVLQEIASMVRFTPENRPIMPPDGEYFLRQNLQLSLMTLRSALLRHDIINLQNEAMQLESWIERYAASGTAKTKFLNVLENLKNLPTQIDESGLRQLVSEGELVLSTLQQRSGRR